MASQSSHAGPFNFLRPLFLAVIFLLLLSPLAHGQVKPGSPPPPPEPRPIDQSKPDVNPTFGSPESEMRARSILKAEKKQYDENLARAREVSELGHQLAEAYETKKRFGSDDRKKLERLEKLTKKIRNEAGGSETNPDVKDIPEAMAAAVKRMAELADDLRTIVEKTPRHVISASVIDQSNKLLGLIQHVRMGRL